MRTHALAVELRLAPVTGLTSFGPGGYVIDTRQATHTVTNSLKPYGMMVYDLIQYQHILAHRAINPNKNVTKFLDAGLIFFKNHAAGSPAHNDNPTTAADLEMQFSTRIDAATQKGSEQIHGPSATGAWLPTTHVAVDNPDQKNASGTTLSKVTSVLAYGPAYGNPTAGWVEFKGGHSLSGTAAANVGAIRAFFDFILHASIAHAPAFSASSFPPIMTAAISPTVSETVSLGNMTIVSAKFTDKGGGTFTEQPAITDPTTGDVTVTATFTAPTVTTGNITLIGNTVITASPADPNAISAQSGVGSKVNNADFAGKLVHVDVDSDASTFDSTSQAELSIPAGSAVFFAGLYWGGFSNTAGAAAKTSVQLHKSVSNSDHTSPVPFFTRYPLPGLPQCLSTSRLGWAAFVIE
jgi:hypothetical protein